MGVGPDPGAEGPDSTAPVKRGSGLYSADPIVGPDPRAEGPGSTVPVKRGARLCRPNWELGLISKANFKCLQSCSVIPRIKQSGLVKGKRTGTDITDSILAPWRQLNLHLVLFFINPIGASVQEWGAISTIRGRCPGARNFHYPSPWPESLVLPDLPTYPYRPPAGPTISG